MTAIAASVRFFTFNAFKVAATWFFTVGSANQECDRFPCYSYPASSARAPRSVVPLFQNRWAISEPIGAVVLWCKLRT